MTEPMLDTGKSAILSDDGKYRYRLIRQWGDGKLVAFVGLNPSTADAQVDDPTIRRMVAFARGWGFPGITVSNLFAVRLTYPAGLPGVVEPIGPENDAVLGGLGEIADLIVVCWGNHGIFRQRCAEVAKLLPPAKCFGLTGIGQPRHPLYLAANTGLVDWSTT